MSWVGRAAHASVVTAIVVTAVACDSLGNPSSPSEGRTPPVQWRSPLVVLTTESQTLAHSGAEELLRRLPPSSLDHYEVPKAGAVTLVTVEPRWGGPVRPGTVPLVTRLTYPDGTVDNRPWSAPSTARLWRATFAVPGAPAEAVTLIAR